MKCIFTIVIIIIIGVVVELIKVKLSRHCSKEGEEQITKVEVEKEEEEKHLKNCQAIIKL